MRHLAAVLLFCASLTPAAFAATYTVTTTANSGAGSLRQGIVDANSGACAAPCTIAFNIPAPVPGSGAFRIQPLTQLPALTAQGVTIDGTTQSAFTGNTNAAGPEIELNGESCADAGCIGLYLDSGPGASADQIVKGLVINKFAGPGIYAVNRVVVALCYLGTDITGSLPMGNLDGIQIGGLICLVGGDGGRNLISGNARYGVWIMYAGPNVVSNNYIGTNANGTGALPNHTGVFSTGATIGSSIPGLGNLVSGNNTVGIVANGGTIVGNTLGVSASGGPLPNLNGASLSGGATFGGMSAGEGNTVAYNSGDGVVSSFASIRGNSFHSNGGFGISLNGGAHPTGGVYSAVYDAAGGTTLLRASQLGRNETNIDIDFYSSTSPDPSGYGEGETYHGNVIGAPTFGRRHAFLTKTVEGNLAGRWSSSRFFGSDVTGTFTKSLQVTNGAARADLSATVTGPPGYIEDGANITYDIVLTNHGPATTSAAGIAGFVIGYQPGFPFTPSAGWNCTFQDTTGSEGTSRLFFCGYSGTLAASQSAALTMTVKGNGGPTTSIAVAAYATDVADVNFANDRDEENTLMNQMIVWELITFSDSPDPAYSGETISYLATIHKSSSGTLRDIVYTQTLPFVTTPTYTLNGWSCSHTNGASSTTVTCTLPTHTGVQSSFIVKVPAPETTGTFSSTATVTAANPDSDPSNNTKTVTTTVNARPVTDLGITKIGPSSACAGSNITYAITITNHGSQSAPNVVVNDATPGGTTFVSTSGSCSGPFPCNIGSVPAGQSRTITATYAISSPYSGASPLVNTASVSATITDPNAANDSASSAATVQSCTTPISSPGALMATATSTTSINVVWNAVSGATGYEVWRQSNGGGFVLIAQPATNSYVDTVGAGTSHAYRVRTKGTGGSVSGFSNVDVATTIFFTDDPLVAGVTPIKAVHITQLRTAVDAVRTAAGLAAMTWTDPSPTIVRAVHINELRTGLSQALATWGISFVLTDPTLTTGMTMKAAHVQELRNLTK